ncbi:Ni/Fe hydrogenase subunit alpha [Candidatus Kuenenbacteria bacterium]|nr:Ni/Fe hydrogenase subunit alpha [Candidatus Kuenenbacteria bacterium]
MQTLLKSKISNRVKTIKINYISKSEGHTGFEAKIVNGKVDSARMDVKEGARLIEGILKGRKIEEAPIITSRICGICPVVHNLVSIKAIENVLDLKIPEQIINLRKLMQYGQIIQSHILHIFFLAISDYIVETRQCCVSTQKDAIKIRDFANKIIETIGGRTTHPITSVIGGFIKIPNKEKLKKLLNKQSEILEISLELLNLFKKIKFPKFERETEFVGLSARGGFPSKNGHGAFDGKNKKEYAIYDGDIISNMGLNISVKKYIAEFQEFQRNYEMVNLVKRKENSFMVGALARLNLSSDQLNKEAKNSLKKINFVLPNYNTFYNIPAQMIEVIHLIEESKKILEKVLSASGFASGRINLKKCGINYKIKAGEGIAAIEAPRGILFHSYKIDKTGRIIKANIITPTAQFLFNLEKDLEKYILLLGNLNSKECEQKIQMLVRAYDLCISCAVH